MCLFSSVPEFGFSSPTFDGMEGSNGVPGTVNAEVAITNGVTIAPGLTVIVNCLASVNGSASTGELHVTVLLSLFYDYATGLYTNNITHLVYVKTRRVQIPNDAHTLSVASNLYTCSASIKVQYVKTF